MTDYADFERRRTGFDRKHQDLPIRIHANVNGSYVSRARSAPKMSWLTPKLIFFVVAFVLIFKTLMIVTTGIATYNSRIDALRDGALWEQTIAWVMEPGTVSQPLSLVIAKLLP